MVHITDPSVRVVLNGIARLLKLATTITSSQQHSGCVVQAFKGTVKSPTKVFYLEPGMSVELEVGRDGLIVVDHEQPTRSPMPRHDHPSPLIMPRRRDDPVPRGDPALLSQRGSIASKREGIADVTPLPLGELPLQSELPGCAG